MGPLPKNRLTETACHLIKKKNTLSLSLINKKKKIRAITIMKRNKEEKKSKRINSYKTFKLKPPQLHWHEPSAGILCSAETLSGLSIPAELTPIDSRELDKLTQVKAQGKQVQREELWCKTNPSNASVEGTQKGTAHQMLTTLHASAYMKN